LKAASKFSTLGIQQVFYLEGGIKSWIENNMPLTGED
jgi:3-mercaptopyruvate sulfurtransferase SseA